MVPEMDPVDHHDGEVTIPERSRQPGRHLLRRERYLHDRRLRNVDELEVIGLLGMLGHGGGSFVV